MGHVDASGNDDGEVFRRAYLNSAFERGIKSPLDDAILAHRELDVKAWHKIDEVPFDFERRRVSVLIDDARGDCLWSKARRRISSSSRWSTSRPTADAGRSTIKSGTICCKCSNGLARTAIGFWAWPPERWVGATETPWSATNPHEPNRMVAAGLRTEIQRLS